MNELTLHDCKKPFLCSCMVEKLSDEITDRLMKIVEEHFENNS